MAKEAGAFALDRVFIQLLDGPAAIAVPAGPDFWARIGERPELQRGRLVLISRQPVGESHWEIHRD